MSLTEWKKLAAFRAIKAYNHTNAVVCLYLVSSMNSLLVLPFSKDFLMMLQNNSFQLFLQWKVNTSGITLIIL